MLRSAGPAADGRHRSAVRHTRARQRRFCASRCCRSLSGRCCSVPAVRRSIAAATSRKGRTRITRGFCSRSTCRLPRRVGPAASLRATAWTTMSLARSGRSHASCRSGNRACRRDRGAERRRTCRARSVGARRVARRARKRHRRQAQGVVTRLPTRARARRLGDRHQLRSVSSAAARSPRREVIASDVWPLAWECTMFRAVKQ